MKYTIFLCISQMCIATITGMDKCPFQELLTRKSVVSSKDNYKKKSLSYRMNKILKQRAIYHPSHDNKLSLGEEVLKIIKNKNRNRLKSKL